MISAIFRLVRGILLVSFNQVGKEVLLYEIIGSMSLVKRTLLENSAREFGYLLGGIPQTTWRTMPFTGSALPYSDTCVRSGMSIRGTFLSGIITVWSWVTTVIENTPVGPTKASVSVTLFAGVWRPYTPRYSKLSNATANVYDYSNAGQRRLGQRQCVLTWAVAPASASMIT